MLSTEDSIHYTCYLMHVSYMPSTEDDIQVICYLLKIAYHYTFYLMQGRNMLSTEDSIHYMKRLFLKPLTSSPTCYSNKTLFLCFSLYM